MLFSSQDLSYHGGSSVISNWHIVCKPKAVLFHSLSKWTSFSSFRLNCLDKCSDYLIARCCANTALLSILVYFEAINAILVPCQYLPIFLTSPHFSAPSRPITWSIDCATMPVQPPFLYDPVKQDPSRPFNDFDPKAVTRASRTPKPPKPKHEGPLISFNQHPE